MFCTKCGAKNEEGATFCSNCGEKLEVAAQNTVQVELPTVPQPTAPMQFTAPNVQPIEPSKPAKKSTVAAVGIGKRFLRIFLPILIFGILSAVLTQLGDSKTEKKLVGVWQKETECNIFADDDTKFTLYETIEMNEDGRYVIGYDNEKTEDSFIENFNSSFENEAEKELFLSTYKYDTVEDYYAEIKAIWDENVVKGTWEIEDENLYLYPQNEASICAYYKINGDELEVKMEDEYGKAEKVTYYRSK